MRIIILSKAPVIGRVKTRLLPEYSAKQAASLHKQMLKATVAKACGIFDDIWLAVDDDTHPYFAELQQTYNFELKMQHEGNLGMRLAKLCQLSFAYDRSPVMFVGTDSPHINPMRYMQAMRAIAQYDVVIGPVEDGGYDLIAMSDSYPELFAGIHWGTDKVFRQTIHIINNIGLSVKVLDKSFDLDRAQDLWRAPPASW